MSTQINELRIDVDKLLRSVKDLEGDFRYVKRLVDEVGTRVTALEKLNTVPDLPPPPPPPPSPAPPAPAPPSPAPAPTPQKPATTKKLSHK